MISQSAIPEAPAPRPPKTPTYKHVTRYQIDSGKLLGGGQVDYEAAPEPGQEFLSGYYDINAEWYNGTTVIAKEPLSATLSSSEVALGEAVTLSPLPIPCTVSVSGAAPIVVDDGSLEVTAESIGAAYVITVDEPRYFRESYTFSVVDP